MRWLTLVLALALFSACDDSTGPGGGVAPEWVAVPLPSELSEGFVTALASGGGRVVGLVRASEGAWVVEERGGQWHILHDAPLPVPDPPFDFVHTVTFGFGPSDLAVDGTGALYVVGSVDLTLGGPGTGPVPAIWTEGDTGWIRTDYEDIQGSLVGVEDSGARGIVAAGVLQDGKHLIFGEGDPGSSLRWTTAALPDADAYALLGATAYDRGTLYLGGALVLEHLPYDVRGLFYSAQGGHPSPLTSPCGACPDLHVEAIEPVQGGLYWAGSILAARTPYEPAPAGWLAFYDPVRDAWEPVQLPREISGVRDLAVSRWGAMYLSVISSGSPEVYTWVDRTFTRETIPDGGNVYVLDRGPDGRVIGGGALPGDSRSEPLMVERVP